MQQKMAPIDIHRHFLNVYEDKTVDVSTVRWWMVCFNSGNSSSGSSLLVMIVTNTACGLLLTAGENA